MPTRPDFYQAMNSPIPDDARFTRQLVSANNACVWILTWTRSADPDLVRKWASENPYVWNPETQDIHLSPEREVHERDEYTAHHTRVYETTILVVPTAQKE